MGNERARQDGGPLPSDADALRRVEVLRTLDEDALQGLAESSILRHYTTGQFMMGVEEWETEVCIIAEGAARLVLYSPDDRVIITGTFGPGEVVGLTLVSGRRRRGLVQATKRVVAYHLRAQLLRQAIAAHPSVALGILDEVVRRLAVMDVVVESIALQDVPTRLAQCLASRAEGDPQRIVRLTQQELAALIAARREYVNRLLGQWQRRGLVRCPTRGQIVVPDPPRLLSTVANLD